MDFRAEARKIFQGDPNAKVVWQPRIEHWFNMNRKRGTLPEQFKDSDIFEVYKDLDASVRYITEAEPVRRVDTKDVTIAREMRDGATIITWKTPLGELRRVDASTIDSWLTTEFPVKNVDDLKIATYVWEATDYEPDFQAYQSELDRMGSRAMPTVIVPRVNVMRLFLEFSGFEEGIFAMQDHPREVRDFFAAVDASDQRYIRAVLQTPAEFINFGDNIHCDLLPPPFLKEFAIPAYDARHGLLHAAGKFTFSHWDGDVASIIPYARETKLDGIEAITFEPMGDATMEMIEEHMGNDLVLIDGICATSFLPFVSMDEFEQEVHEIIDRLHPHLILGVSDEPPPDAQYEKLKRVTEIVTEYNKKMV